MWNGSRFVLLLLFGISLMSCAPLAPEETSVPPVEETAESTSDVVTEVPISPEEKQLSQMSLEEKIHQLFVFGTYGTEPSDHLIGHVKKGLGGVIFFARNIQSEEQLKDFTASLRGLEGDVPLLLSTDEEGGRVQRLEGVSEPVHRAFDVTEETAFSYGASLGKNLRQFDLNTGYAPVLDIYSNESNTVIGDRALSRTPEGVISYLPEVLRGLESEGVLSVGKHFPGHGDTTEDSHEVLPVVTKSVEELEALELIPFKRAIELDIDMIMVGHLLVEAMDETYPASFSKAVIGDYLRDTMGYEGVVITDDLTMGAVTEDFSIDEVVQSYLLGGGDLLLVCHDEAVMDQYLASATSLVERGLLSEDALDEKVLRILKMKEKMR